MKKLILLFGILLSVGSCTTVKFEAPQPAEAPSLNEFPEKMIGIYTSEEQDTLRISRNSFSYSSGKEVNMSTNLTSPNAVLKKLNNTYILNLRDNGSWDVFPIKVTRNKISVFYAGAETGTEKLLEENTASVKEIKTGEGRLDHYLVELSSEQFQRLLRKKLFSEKVVFRRLK